MPSDEKVKKTCCVIFLAVWVIGIVYLGLGNTFSDRYVGILQRGSVYTDTNCNTHCNSEGKNCHTSCDNTYYVDQIFLKNDHTTSTCTVQRPTPYYFKGDADNFVSRMKLGTTRQLYQTTYSHGTCIDNKIRNRYNAIGGTLFGFTTLIMIACLLFVFAEQISRWKVNNFDKWTFPSCTLPICCRRSYWITSSTNNFEEIKEVNKKTHFVPNQNKQEKSNPYEIKYGSNIV